MECACRSIMLRQDELAFLKALSTFQVSPAMVKELRLELAKQKTKKRPAVPTGRRCPPSGVGTSASGKRKASELASSGESMEPASRRPAPGLLPPPATATATGEQAASCSRQPGPSGVGASYAAILSASVALSQPSGPPKPTAMGSDSSESGVSIETPERRMSKDMSGHAGRHH